MRICENGVVRDMTAEEEAVYKAMVEEQTADTTPTVEERVTAVEEKVSQLETLNTYLTQIEEVYAE
jgi:hypothetical protein